MQYSPPNSSLWQRLQAWSPDDPDAAHPFSQKLAHEQRWSSQFAHRAIAEYRRFVFLCCTLPGGASPSPAVDEVWHLHLTYTLEYWQHFCPDVLQHDLHHHPSKGGPDQRQHHDGWYTETLKQYERHFGEPPPADLWPPPAGHAQTTAPHRFSPAPWLLFFVPSLITGTMYGQPIPFFLSGRHFMTYFGVFAVVSLALLLRALLQAQQGFRQDLVERGVDEQEAAFLTGGRERIFLYLLSSLINDKSVATMEGSAGYYLNRSNLRNSASPVAAALLQTDGLEPISVATLRLHAAGIVNEVQARFGALITDYKAKLTMAIYRMLPLGILFILRLLQAGYHQKPVGHLVACGFVTGLIALLLLSAFKLQPAAARLLRTVPEVLPLPPNDFNRDLIFGGVAAIAGWAAFSQLAADFQLFAASRNSRDTSFGSGCGGDGGACGSSCGSSGCGSGCGGCGGGGD